MHGIVLKIVDKKNWSLGQISVFLCLFLATHFAVSKNNDLPLICVFWTFLKNGKSRIPGNKFGKTKSLEI
jgi:hypothetical protein